MKKILFKKEIDSTNTHLKTNYQKFNHFTVLYTNHQTKGKGRISHNWYDEKGKNLLMSILLKDLSLNNYLNDLTLVVAVAVYKVLEKYISNITIKWPNDIYVNGLKICGILTEGVTINNQIEAIIVGIGLNVNGTVYPDDIKNNTTSLKILTNKTFNRKRLLKKIVKTFKKELDLLKQNDRSYLQVIRDNFYLLNKTINYEKNNNIYTGKVLGIDDDGKLIVDVNNKTEYLFTGEVTLKKKEV